MTSDGATAGDPGNGRFGSRRAEQFYRVNDPAQRHATAPVREIRWVAPDREDATSRNSESGLSPERVAEIRKRILDGAYDSLEAVDRVARRIVERGDI